MTSTQIKTINTSHPSLSRSLKKIIQILNFDIIKEINTQIKKDKNISILDLGCGVGRSLWDLSQEFSSKTNQEIALNGIHYNEKPSKDNPDFLINYNRQASVRKNPEIIAQEFNIPTDNLVTPKIIHADASISIPYEDESIDFIYSSNAFHYFPDKLKALQEVSRILKINSKAIIYLDRKNNNFWPKDFFFPSLHIHQEEKIINAKEYLETKSNQNFTLKIKQVTSPENNENSYIVQLTKHQSGELKFKETKFIKSKSFVLDNIRTNSNKLTEIPEFQSILKENITFKQTPKKEFFRGFLSYYNI